MMEFQDVTTPAFSRVLNSSIETSYISYTTSNAFGSFMTVLIALISIIGNIAVVLVSFWSETLRVQTANILIVYLSSVDIMTGIFLMIPSAISVAYNEWILGTVLCKLQCGLNYMFACSSSFNLAVISFDRAIAVFFPFRYRIMMTTKIMIMFCCIIFLLSFIIGLCCGIPDWNSYDYSEGMCAMDYTTSIGVYYLFTSGCFFCYYTPAVMIAICNSMIIIRANKSGNSVQPLMIKRENVNKLTKDKVQDMHMKKTIKSITVVVIFYYICFTPYAISKQLKVVLGIDMPQWFNYMTTILIFMASAINPFIYAILRKDFRDAFKRLPRMLREKFHI